MCQKPFVSVVIPTYNRACQVIAAVESVLAQSYSRIEIVIIDDGSTDGTADAVQALIGQQAASSKPIRYFFQENQGQSRARNRGIAEVRGDWIAFLDSDDKWLPDKLEWQVRAVEQYGGQCGACFTDSRLCNWPPGETTGFLDAGRNYDQDIGIDTNATINLATSFANYWVSSLLAKADVIKQINGFDPQIPFAEDRDFDFRLSLATQFCYVNKVLVFADRGLSPPGSICRPWDDYEVRLKGQQSIYEKWLKMDFQLPPAVKRIIRSNLGILHSTWASWYLENEQYVEARGAASRALRYQFTLGLAAKWALTHWAPTLSRKTILAKAGKAWQARKQH